MGEAKRTITSKGAKYEVLRKLGEGYSGEVFLVHDSERKENLALKLLNPEAFKEGQLEAFKREFITLSGLHHPHLCKVYDFGFSESDKRYFFTSEVVQGTDLYTYTDKLPNEEMEEIFVQVADALGFIHAAGLIHFDMKGANVLITTVDDKPLAKIVDFGLAARPADAPENVVGTVRYMSPEMITKNQAIDYRSDLYSLGIILYRMLARTYPNQGGTLKEVLSWHARHTTIEAGPLEEHGAPKYLIDIIVKLLNPIPAERFSSADVIIKYIELHSGRSYKKTQRELITTLAEEGPLVGRDEVMFEIRSTLNKLSKGEPPEEDTQAALILTGPSGIGKTRLLKEARYLSQLNELKTVAIRGREEGQDIERFKRAAALDTDGGKAQPKEIIDALLLQKGLCLMIDDLDECNQMVKDVVTGLVHLLYTAKFMGKPLPVYLIITMTTKNEKEVLPVPIHLGVEVEHLKPFSKEDITQYLRLLLGESNPPPKQISDIYKFSGGIPELVRTAIASLDSATARMQKDTMKFFLGHIEKLSPASKKILGLLSVAESALSHQQLITLTGSLIEAPVNELIASGLVVQNRQAGSYEIATGAILCAAREALNEEEKKQIAGALLNMASLEDPQDVDAIVRYAGLSEDPGAVVELTLKAAKNKEEKAEIEQSYAYYQQAISVLGEEDERVPDIHRKMARYLLLTRRYGEAREHLNAASKKTGVDVSDLTSLSWIERLQQRPKEALAYIQQAIDSTASKKGEAEYFKLLNEKALCYLQMGEADKAIEIFKDTDKQVKKLAGEEFKKVVNNNLGMALAHVGKFNEAIEFYLEKQKYFSEDKQLSASILSQLGYVYQHAGRLEDALSANKKSWEIASEMGDTHSSAAILGNIISVCQNKALFSDALHYAEVSLRLTSQAASEHELATNFLTVGSLYVNLGLEDVAKKYLNEAAAIFQQIKDVRLETWVQLSFAYLYKNTDKPEEALAYFTNVIKQSASIEDRELTIWGHCGAAEILMDKADAAGAENHLNSVNVKWNGLENAKEEDIKVEMLRQRLKIIKEKNPGESVVKRLKELAELAMRQGRRELVGEAYHILTMYYQKMGDDLTSAKYISKAKEIIEDIAGTLAEEYRESFLKQQFRKTVYEESLRLEESISHISADNLPEEARPAGADEATPKKVEDRTVGLPEGENRPGADLERYKLVGQSGAIETVRQIVEQVKDSSVPVLIEGEKGTEKGLVARYIWSEGANKNQSWQEMEISDQSGEFLREELFGGRDAGILEKSSGGVTFLKYVDKMPISIQKELAKAIKKQKFVSPKGRCKIPLRTRIIASTSANLDQCMKEKKLNKKFLKQMSSVLIHVLPLRSRREDIPLLINHYMRVIEKEVGAEGPANLETGALKLLMEHDWPENVGEMVRVLRSCYTLVVDNKITEERVRILLKD